MSEARARRMARGRDQYVSKDALSNLEAAVQHSALDQRSEVERLKRHEINKYVEREQYKIEFLEHIKPHILRGLSFVHDYKQVNAAINQNINVLLETRYQGATLDEKLAKAADYEKAIYWAGRFLVEKLNAARFLIHPDAINKPSDYSKFRVHGSVTKYTSTFGPRFVAKRVRVFVNGSSYGEIIANADAVGVIPQTFLDNALKYSPKDSKVEIVVNDEKDGVFFSVTSYGPRIHSDEMERIFEPFYRGRDAEKQEEEGAGYGLYLAQLIAREHLGTKIVVQQEPVPKPAFGFLTTFSVLIPPRARHSR